MEAGTQAAQRSRLSPGCQVGVLLTHTEALLISRSRLATADSLHQEDDLDAAGPSLWVRSHTRVCATLSVACLLSQIQSYDLLNTVRGQALGQVLDVY